MGEMVASRCRQVLEELKVEDEDAWKKIKDEVEKWLSKIGNIEKLLNNDGIANSIEVKENMRKIRNVVYKIEDTLEIWAVLVEEFMPSKIEKKRGITRFLRCFGRGDEGSDPFYVQFVSVMKHKLEHLIMLFHDMFPVRALKSDTDADADTDTDADADTDRHAKKFIEWSLAHRRSLRLPRPMYAHGGEGNYIGREVELEKLVDWVSDQDENHRVVSIWGAKGLGKTNLARRVYIHSKVRTDFKAFAWVPLSKDYQIDDLLQNILNQLDAGAVKRSAEAVGKSDAYYKKGAEEKKDLVAEEQEIGADEKKEGAEKKKEGAEKSGSRFQIKKKKGAEAVTKSAADHKKEGVEAKKELGAEEQIKGAHEKKEGAEKSMSHLKYIVKKAEAVGKSAAYYMKGAEEKKKLVAGEQEIGAHETKEGSRENKKASEEQERGADEKKQGSHENKKGAEEQPKSSEETMMDQLKEILTKQRCFIVIDDVSESSQWEDISSKLPVDCALTKFLLTTENEDIAANVGIRHDLRSLTEDQGWELLQKYAFRGKKAPVSGLIPKLGKEIVGTCDCLPSAISIIGTTLSEMSSSVNEWHKVNDDVAGYKESNGRSNDDDVVPISNYDGLSYREKQCFLYLAIFKEDEGVDLEDLSFLWMGEGMLEKRTTEYYLLELKSMLHVQVDELSTNRMFISLQNHARELSLQQGEREDLRLKVVDFSGGKQPSFDRYTLFDGIRRLVIHFNKLSSTEEPRYLYANYDLRSLLFLNSDWEYVHLPVTISDFSEFTLLRILHFVRCKFEKRELPQGIDKLFNLRYLGVLYCDLEGLPPSIANFRNLQVLNVRSYEDSKIVIPNVISQMVSLKHVRLPSNSESDGKKLKLDVKHVRLPSNSESDGKNLKLDVKHVRLPSNSESDGKNLKLDDKHVRLPSNSESDDKKLKLDVKHVRLQSNSESDDKKLKLDRLSDLETLDGLNADIHDLDSLSKLEKLRHLSTHAYSISSLKSIIEFVKNHGARIRTNLLIEHQCDFTSQEGMTVLEEVLMCPNLNALTFSMVVMPMFPNCKKYASEDVTQIKLIGCKLSEDPMEALGKFRNLGKLWLAYGAFVGTTIAIGDDGGFPNLEYLEFRCLPKLEKWRVHEGAMKKLSTLIVRKCPKLKGIPDGLMASVSSHNNVEIELPLTALAQGWEENYKNKFGLVKSHGSGGLKDLQVALVKLTKQVDQKNKLPAGADTGAAGAGTSSWGGVDDTGALMEANGDISMEET